jgi:cation-transporting ATPase E
MAAITANQPQAATSPRGLSESEASTRRAQGQGNNFRQETSRSYADIIRHNVLNLMNIILFAIGAVMISIGRVGDAVTSVGLIALNVVIGIYQEIRAKRQLDQIALLTRPKVSVIRDGAEKVIDPTDLVIGDLIVVRAGDQLVVDGRLIGDGKIDVDESLLTGEADLIPKKAGDEVLSGSFCVTGTATYEATRVGAESFANKLTANARKFRIVRTPMQREINFLLRLIMLLAGFIGFLLLIATVVSAVPFMRQVQMAAVIAGLVPNGLFFMVVLAYAMGALRIAQRGALVQQTNAVESLSNVTVLCMDKTGTLTANKINYHSAYPIGIPEAQLTMLLGDFAASASANNKTGEAILNALKGSRRAVLDEVPFSSARKWSALAFDDGVYVLGALEMLSSSLQLDKAALDQLSAWSDAGLRVLVFGHNPTVKTLHGENGEPQLPDLTPLGIISFSDELRPALKETLAEFSKNGIRLKVISGDNPKTVAALAKQAGLPGDLKYISGPELDEMDDALLGQVAAETTVFGRITPQQKERLVDALRQQGHYVAMIGDGVNDVLSLKKANMGIAMQSGSAATRSVADMILLNDSFGALPPAFTEGQRIVNGMSDILRLFLTRVLYAALLILATAVIGFGFPYVPKHVSLLVLLSVGIPTFGLAIWARPGVVARKSLLAEVMHFVVPAAISVFFFGLLVYSITFVGSLNRLVQVDVTPDAIASFQKYANINYDIQGADQYVLEVAQLTAQTALTVFTLFSGLLLVVFVEPPHPFFVGGDVYSGDKRPTILAFVMLLIYLVMVAVEPFRKFWELMPLPFWGYLAIAGATLVWMLVLRQAWRKNWLERFLDLDGPKLA